MQNYQVIDFPYRDDAESLFGSVRSMPNAIWLDSGKPHSHYGRFDIITASPDKIITINNGSTSTNAFQQLQHCLDELGTAGRELTNYPFVGGLAGYWGYDLGHSLNHLDYPEQLQHTSIPDMRIGRYLWSLVLNHNSRQGHLFFHPLCSTELIEEVKELLLSTKAYPQETTEPFKLSSPFQPSITKQSYIEQIGKIQQYIQSGDCYQVNFAQHFSATFDGDPWIAYRQLRRTLPSPYSAYLAWDTAWAGALNQNSAILSLSPERFLKHSMGQVEAKPIKGTMPRGSTLTQDEQLASQLQNSLKDRAENLMIVDLLRNDLSKSCKPGTVKVPRLFQLESFKNVHHLVSTITGTLKNNHSALNLLKEAFPGGSITGAPKRRAMEIISELEIRGRSTYCGSIGYISVSGRMDTNIAIRTLVASNGTLNCWGGGGIVADSEPEKEYQESINKVQILMDTLQKYSNS